VTTLATRDDLTLLTRLAPVASIRAEQRTAELVWSTGAGVKRYDWLQDRYYLEELSLDPAHVDMSRLAAGAPLLNAHNTRELSSVLGVVERAWIRNGEARALVRFSERPDVEPIWRDVQAGIIRNVSVGYYVETYQTFEGQDEKLPVYRAVKWQPAEISLVPVGADAGAGTRAKSLELNMSDAVEAGRGAGPGKIRAIVAAAKLDSRFADDLIEASVTEQQARDLVVDELARRNAGHQIRGTWDATHEAPAQAVAERKLMADALAARYGGTASEAATRKWGGATALDLARACAEQAGISTRGRSRAGVFDAALSARSIGIAHGTSDFVAVTADAASKILRTAYDQGATGVVEICGMRIVPDFKPVSLVQLSDTPALQKTAPGGEIRYGTMKDSASSIKLDTYAALIGISRQALVNDDLDAFMTRFRGAGVSASETRNVLCTAVLASNPTMSDTVALFHADHGNLAGSGAAIDVTTVAAGFAAMRLQKGLGSTTPINISPRFLVVPAAKEMAARQFVASITPATIANANPFAGALTVVVDPRLDAYSTTAWYLAAEPSAVDTLIYAHLEGSEGPRVEYRQGWEVEGLELKVVYDVAAAAVDFRGLYKNPGA